VGCVCSCAGAGGGGGGQSTACSLARSVTEVLHFIIFASRFTGYPIRFCHAEFEEAKTRSCDKLGTKSITTILHFFIPGL
jgi:hypothetical protein